MTDSRYYDPEYKPRRRRGEQTANTEPSPAETPANDNEEPRQKRKTSQRKPQKAPRRSSLVRFLTDRRLHGIVGVLLILVGAYALLASISFISTGSADQSLINNRTISVLADKSTEVKNIGGPVGAFISDTLMNDWLGLGSFVLIAYVILLGLALIKVKSCHFWSMTFRTLVLAIGLSILLGSFTSPFPLGGVHGLYVNNLLHNTLGELGRLFALVFVLALVVYVYLNDLARVYRAYRKRVEARRERKRIEDEAREAQAQLVRDAMTADPLTAETESQDTPETITDQVVNFKTTLEEIPDTDDEVEVSIGNPIDHSTPQPSDGHSVTEDGSVTFEVEAPKLEQADVDVKTDATGSLNTPYDHRADLSHYKFPPLDLLVDIPAKENNVDLQEQEYNKERITKTLSDYQIPIQQIRATVGPTVTLYEIVPAEGVRIAKIKRLEDDIAMSLAALGIRIIAPIPGRGTIGIEVPNKDPQTVSIRSIIGSRKFQECKYALPMAMGATIANEVFIADLTKMPHLLVAGATGQGKSVGLNTIIACLLYKKHPSELKFVLIDPKMVEFSLYSKIENHFLAKLPDEGEAIITDTSKVVATLNSLCTEMDQRYDLLRKANCRSIIEYNNKFTARSLNPEKGHRYLPYIVVIVDEFADLIMTAGKEVETPIARIAQKARAVGIHMIIATQRPSTNVITGIIKANFPGRIGFRVTQMVDSRTILDRPGAEQLIGRGDMLFSINGEILRMQCAFIDTPEVEAIVDYIDNQQGYPSAYELPEPIPVNDGTNGIGAMTDTDSLFEEAARIVVQSGVASTSSLQRRYSIGYNRAGKIMDQLESAGIVGPAQGGKPREILVDMLALERILESKLQ